MTSRCFPSVVALVYYYYRDDEDTEVRPMVFAHISGGTFSALDLTQPCQGCLLALWRPKSIDDGQLLSTETPVYLV